MIHRRTLLTGATLAGVELLIIAHPSDPAWERTTGMDKKHPPIG